MKNMIKKLRKNGNLPTVNKFFNKKVSRVLVIGDLHAPFTLDSYLEHCVSVYRKYNCNSVVFIGDIIDSHYSSFHATDPDGLGGGDELDLAIQKLQPWIDTFPIAKVCWGNHDLIIQRRAFDSSIPKAWIKDINELLGSPQWEWAPFHIIDGVKYTHGTGGKADKRAVGNLESTVCGHYHTEAYVKYHVGYKHRIFSMQVGCGIEHEQYAFAYAKESKKPIISAGVVINGNVAMIDPMIL